MRYLLPILILPLLAGCGSGGGGSSSSGGSTPAPTSTTWAADLVLDNMGAGGVAPYGETDTTVTIRTGNLIDMQTAKFGKIEKASGTEWYGGPSNGWLLVITYNAEAKTVEIRRPTEGTAVRWNLTAMPAGAG